MHIYLKCVIAMSLLMFVLVVYSLLTQKSEVDDLLLQSKIERCDNG